MENYLEFLQTPLVKDVLILIFSVAIASLVYRIVQKYALPFVQKILSKIPFNLEQLLREENILETANLLIPVMLLFRVTPFLTIIGDGIDRILQIWAVVVLSFLLNNSLKIGLKIYNRFPISTRMPLKGIVQIASIGVWVFAGTAILSLLLDQSPWILLSGLGALSAVLLLIFQDTILSFVAGMQLTLNDQIRVGDWIEVPQYSADGDVEEVSLHNVRVRNWDKTITTIPTNKLVGDSFKNWRGMFETGGRRIKRSVLIDQNSVKFLDEDLFNRLSKIQLLQDYLKEKSEEIARYNEEQGIDTASIVNGRHLTNLGTFRAYLQAYLRNHPQVNQDLTLIVRQLEPSTSGLPMELYLFSKSTAWVVYEGLQADIFDHVLAIISEFDLRVFQDFGGHDFRERGY